MFDWLTFLTQHRVQYKTAGRNTSRGNVAVKCPFCGSADPSEHMNISLAGNGWACWRDSDHKGVKPTKLIQALLNCSWQEALAIAGVAEDEYEKAIPLAEFVARHLDREKPKPRKLDMPRGLKPISSGSIHGRIALNYLRERGFTGTSAQQVADRFKLHSAPSGPWAGRVVFPIYNELGALVNLVGRAVSKRVEQRYKTLSSAESIQPMSQCLFDLPALVEVKRAETLVVCEGPFDAAAITWYGERHGVYATCLFTVRLARAQLDLLHELRPAFKRLVLVLDEDAHIQAAATAVELYGLGAKSYRELGSKDPGSLSPAQLATLCRHLASL